MAESKKQITFDLSQDALKRYYPHKETGQDPQFFKKAYKDIRRFMEASGFERRQYSVYVSTEQRSAAHLWGPRRSPAKRVRWGEEEGMERAESSPSGGDGAERNFFRRRAGKGE